MEIFKPFGLPAQPVSFTNALFFFNRSGTSNAKQVFSSHTDIEASYAGQDGATVVGSFSASDTNGDLVNDRAVSAFNYTLAGVADLSIGLTQQVSTGPAATASITHTYVITNNAAAAIAFDLVRNADYDLVWDGDFVSDQVMTDFNTLGGDRRAGVHEPGGFGNGGVILSSPVARSYVGAKNGVDPDGVGPDPAMGFGTDPGNWYSDTQRRVPLSWRNHIAGVGTNVDGTSSSDPGGTGVNADGFLMLEWGVTLDPGASTTISIRYDYVPEPATGLLMALAATALRRR
jgi:hypothetical protein